MSLREFLDPASVDLHLRADSRELALAEMVALLHLGDRPAATVVRQLHRREMLGSTGFGSGIAIPHCRTLAVTRLRLAFGRHEAGIPWQAMDGRPVHAVFLIVAPPAEISNQYLPLLGRIAQFVQDPQVPRILRGLHSVEEFWSLLDQRGV
ncbi:MAG: phosphoenolpyruvate-dependent sugar phosphotransferase system 2 [Gemmatimonadetes bacterium]|nr:phosphoenolpyruvate-dependent sugar phosphotransferase system 2 [Gemmatimonadota bacterium]